MKGFRGYSSTLRSIIITASNSKGQCYLSRSMFNSCLLKLKRKAFVYIKKSTGPFTTPGQKKINSLFVQSHSYILF